MKGVNGGEEGGAGEAKGGDHLGKLLGDDAGFSNAGEEDGTGCVEKRLREVCSLGEVEEVEEVIDVAALRLEHAAEIASVDLPIGPRGIRQRGR